MPPPPPPPPNQNLFPTPLAQGGCNCRSFYDGQEDLLFYLENKHLLTYGLLFQYLHLMIMIEGKNPLAAFHRSVGHAVPQSSWHYTTSYLEDPSLILECFIFARLFNLKFIGNFQCPVCGCSPETIICDGTLVEFRKDLLPTLLQEPDRESLSISCGSKHRSCLSAFCQGTGAAYEVQWLFQGSEDITFSQTTSELQSMLRFVERRTPKHMRPHLIPTGGNKSQYCTTPLPCTELPRNSVVPFSTSEMKK